AVAENGESARVGGDQHQSSVGSIVTVQAGASELVGRAFERIDRLVGNHPDGDPSGRAVFGARDSLRDPRAVAAGHGLKFTVGGFSAPGWAAKYGFSLNLLPNIPAKSTVGKVSRLVLNVRATSLYFLRS